jgi:hypothetical protein
VNDALPTIPRPWLSEQILNYLRQEDVRIVVLTGEPGTGKSVELQSLLDEHRSWLSYFVRRDSKLAVESGNAIPFLITIGHEFARLCPEAFEPKNLELVVKQRVQNIERSGRVIALQVEELTASPFWQTAIRAEQHVEEVSGSLDAVVIRHMSLEPRLLTPEVLTYMAIRDPAALLSKLKPHETVVILVDAVDEVDSSEDLKIVRWLAEFPALPNNIKFIISSRPTAEVDYLCSIKTNVIRRVHLSSTIEEVQHDIGRFVSACMLQRKDLAPISFGAGNSEEFADAVITKADGNFQYVASLFRAFASGQFDELSGATQVRYLDLLPKGLFDLYRFFVDRLRQTLTGKTVPVSNSSSLGQTHEEAWTVLYQPLLGVLGVAKQSLNVQQLHAMACPSLEFRWTVNAMEKLQPFTEIESGCFKLFHRTFADFLTSDETLRRAPAAYVGSSEWHRSILNSYRSGHLSWQSVDWNNVDDYGLLYLMDHIIQANYLETPVMECNQLLCAALWRAEIKRFGSDKMFTQAVRLLLKLACRSPQHLPVVFRTGMLLARLSSLHLAIPEHLAIGLGVAGKVNRAYDFITLQTNLTRRVLGYADFANALIRTGDQKTAANCVKEGCALLKLFIDEKDKRRCIVRLSRPAMRFNLLTSLISEVNKFSNSSEADKARISIVRGLVLKGEFRRALRIARSIQSVSIKALILLVWRQVWRGQENSGVPKSLLCMLPLKFKASTA